MRVFSYAVRNIFRSMSMSVSIVITLILMVFFVQVLLFLQYLTERGIYYVSQKIPFVVYLDNWITADDDRVINFMSEISEIHPNIWVQYVSPQEALIYYQARFEKLSSTLEENPLPASIRIDIPDIAIYDLIYWIIQEYDDIFLNSQRRSIDNYVYLYEKIQELIGMLKAVYSWVYGIIVLFLFSMTIILYITIGNYVFFYQDHIKVTRLVGGSKRYVYGPYILQALLYSLFSMFMSFFLFFLLFYWMTHIELLGVFSEIFTTQLYGNFLSWWMLKLGIIFWIILWVSSLTGLYASYKFVNRV